MIPNICHTPLPDRRCHDLRRDDEPERYQGWYDP